MKCGVVNRYKASEYQINQIGSIITNENPIGIDEFASHLSITSRPEYPVL